LLCNPQNNGVLLIALFLMTYNVQFYTNHSMNLLGHLVCALPVQVDYANFTRLNHTKAMVVVNGQFPGPAIRAHEGDIIVVNVTNLVASPITIHW